MKLTRLVLLLLARLSSSGRVVSAFFTFVGPAATTTTRTRSQHRGHRQQQRPLFSSKNPLEPPETNDTTVVSREEALRRLLNQNNNNEETEEANNDEVSRMKRRNLIINVVTAGLLVACGVALAELFVTSVYTPSGFRRLPSTQFIAALGDPEASQGKISRDWGLWRADPGPRGVWLRDYDNKLQANDNVAPAGWKFDVNDWWLEEHGIIMEQPEFPLSPGRYLVTGGRSVTTGLTIDEEGNWKLDDNHTLYEVTHLPCRSARYRPNDAGGSPKTANLSNFPVKPGAEMPEVAGCDKQDYSVLFLVGKAL